MKRNKRHKVKAEPETSTSHNREQEVHDLAYYIHDRVELMHQVFSVIKYKELKAMVPASIRNISLDDLQELCTEELLGISSKRLCAILDGAEPPSDTESSSPSPPPEQMETISLDSISSDDEILSQSSSKKKKHKHRRHSKSKSKRKRSSDKEDGEADRNKASRAGLTVLELLELQARARAIRAQLQQEQKPVAETASKEAPHSSDNEVEIKEEPAEVVEISSDEEKPKLEELQKKITEVQEATPAQEPPQATVTKRINDLVITVPQKTKQKIKLKRTKSVTATTETNSVASTDKTKDPPSIATTENAKSTSSATTTKIVEPTEKIDDNKNAKKDKSKKKKKDRKNVSKDDIDNDEITLQLSDTEKMDLLEDLDRKHYDSVSSESSSDSSSDSDGSGEGKNTDSGLKEKNGGTKKEGKDSELKAEKVAIETGKEVTGTVKVAIETEKVAKDTEKVAGDTGEVAGVTEEVARENGNVTKENGVIEKVSEDTEEVAEDTEKMGRETENVAPEIKEVTSEIEKEPDADQQTDGSPENASNEIITEDTTKSTDSKSSDVVNTKETEEMMQCEDTVQNNLNGDITEVNLVTESENVESKEKDTAKNETVPENSAATIKEIPTQTTEETKNSDKNLSEGELSDQESSEVEAVDLKPEVVCISDDEEGKKAKKKKKKKEKKAKKEKSKKKSDFRESADQNFYKDKMEIDNSSQEEMQIQVSIEIRQNGNNLNSSSKISPIDVIDKVDLTTEKTIDEDTTTVKQELSIRNEVKIKTNSPKALSDSDVDAVYEIMELSDDSSCCEVECTTILSKEPTASEIEALSAKIDEIERVDVITDKEIRDYEREKVLEEIEHISWKDRYLDSKKVKKVLTTANILNALRKKNIELKKKLAESKIETEETVAEEKEVPDKNMLEEGSIEHYNTLEALTKYVDPVKEIPKDLKKDAKLLLKMYKKLLKFSDINKSEKKHKKKKKKIKKDLEKNSVEGKDTVENVVTMENKEVSVAGGEELQNKVIEFVDNEET